MTTIGVGRGRGEKTLKLCWWLVSRKGLLSGGWYFTKTKTGPMIPTCVGSIGDEVGNYMSRINIM